MNYPYKRIKLIIIFIFINSLFYYSYAQQIVLNSVPQLDDYPSNSVTRIYQDKSGYIWLGTMDGICRYDGYRILSFRSDFSRNNLLTNNQITSITEDANYIWIGTEEGINLLDKKTYIIFPFHDEEIQQQSIKSILVDADESIWIGTNSFVYHYTKEGKLIKRFDEYPSILVNQIYQDSQGNIWILTWNSGLFKYKKENDRLISYPKIGNQNIPFRMFQDKNDRYWICTWGDGIYLFNPEKNTKDQYVPQKLSFDKNNISKNTFFSIAQDAYKGYIWIISFSGVHAFSYSDPANPVLEEIDVKDLFEDSNNIFSELIKDNNGNIWIGTYNEGAHTISFDKPIIKNYTLESIKRRFGVASNIKALHKDKDDLFWIFQNRIGLGTYDSQTNIFKLYDEYPHLKPLENLKFISCITSPSSINDEIWIGSENQSIIYKLKKDKDNIQLLDAVDLRKQTSRAGFPLVFFNDKRHNTWIGTTSSLFIKDYNSDNIRLVSDTIGYITGITEDCNGKIWISTSRLGIYSINTQSSYNMRKKVDLDNWKQGSKNLSSNNIQTICADSKGQIWIGTKKGTIEVYNPTTDQFEDLTKVCGIEGYTILNIICDSLTHIWILSSRSVTEYSPENNAYYNYNTNDGMAINYFHKNSLAIDNNGLLFFGGNKGFVELAPSETLSIPTTKERVLISDIEIQGKSVFYLNNNNKFDVEDQILTLDPNDRNIEIRFSSLDYIYPSKIRFCYKLEGVDEDWIYTDTNRQFAAYNQLGKGKYIFLVRSTNENGLWNDDVTKLTIYRLPAFYETWWAYTIYTSIFIICLLFAYRTALNRIRLKNKLSIARIEREKTEELTQSKLRYFTNISHDFLTPLTIISCIIDDLGSDTKKDIPQYDTIKSNINRLKRLLQQILDFRKVESGNMRLKVSNSNIAVFIKDTCYTNFSPLINKNEINFSFITETNDINAYFDLDKIEKIVCNLLSNAFKYTPNGGEISVSISQVNKEDNKFIELKVSDTGIGIHPKDINKVFYRFYSNKDNIKEESNGIGLSLTKDLIELHHGQIYVDSIVDQGSTFTVIIPIDKASYTNLEITGCQETESNKDSISLEAHVTDQSNGDKEKVSILLVEDNQDILIIMNSILSRNYNITTATNGNDALILTKDNDFDIIVSDVMMPQMDGLELCQTIKADIETSHISVLLLTAKNTAEDRIECYNAGADGYLSKPFELKVLEARINNLVNNKKTKQKEFKSNVEINISTLEYASNDEIFLSNAVLLIEKYISESEFGINTFAEHMNMSKSSLYRKIKSMTGLSPIEFIRNIRLKHACNMLKNKSISISEVAYSVGFSDPKYFTFCFKTEFEMTPSEYQKNI